MSTVNIENVRKSFGRIDILHGVGFDIADGEFVVLVGPSGCGKSTLLRMIAGLESISGGRILIGDRVVNDLPVKERDIAMVFQSYALYPHLNVEKNMGFSLRLAKRPAGEVRDRVDRAAATLDLQALLERYPRELSGGQRQRVAMGRAMVRDPKVFLFDEPLSNLDAKLRVQMRAEIKELHQRLKTTVVYVTHDQIEAMTMADRIVVMNGGRIEQIGAPLDLYDRPANTFVATFIGTPAMNLLRGSLEGSRFSLGEGLSLALPSSIRGNQRGAMLYGVRPEGFELDASGVPLQVVVVEPTGPETQLLGTIAGQKVSINLHQRVRVEPGQTLMVRPVVEGCHLFDAESGRRVEN